MWVVDNKTDYASDRTSVISKDGRVLWVVIVKATYDIKRDGTTSVADDQATPILVPEYNGEDGASSLAYETDLVAPKPATDVLINGFAYAPGGKPSTKFIVGFDCCGLHKALTVRGNRRWYQSMGTLKPSDAEPVTRVPLFYELAFGGYDNRDSDPANHTLDPRNPVGCGVTSRAENLIDTMLPNFEYPGKSLVKAGPAGLGAIACFWKPRVDFGGTYDDTWIRKRKPLLPEDFDDRYFQAAPEDQQLSKKLPKDAHLHLTNLSPRGELSVKLPCPYLVFTTFFSPAARRQKLDHRAKLNTILVEPERERLIMVWSTVLDCGRDIDHIEATRVVEKSYSW